MALFLPSTTLSPLHVVEEVRSREGREGDAALKLMTKAKQLVLVHVKLVVMVVVAFEKLGGAEGFCKAIHTSLGAFQAHAQNAPESHAPVDSQHVGSSCRTEYACRD